MPRHMMLQKAYNFLRCRGVLASSCHCSHFSLKAWTQERQMTNSSQGTTIMHSHKPAMVYNTQHFKCMSSGVDSDSDSEEVTTDLIDREKDPSETLRDILYPNCQDPLIIQINEARSVQDVFSFLHKNQNNLNAMHLSQCVLILWDLQKTFCQIYNENYCEDNILELDTYMKAVTGHPDFHNLLRLIKIFSSELNPNALTCTLLYLIKMGVDHKHPTIEELLSKCEKNVVTYSLTSLSRFLVAVHGRQLWSISMSQPFIPFIFNSIETCSDAEQLRLLTICLANVHYFVTPEILDEFKGKVKRLIDSGVIGSHSPRTIVKIIMFLDFPRWSRANADLIRDLMHSLSGKISELKINDVVMLHKAFQGQLEPVKILQEIQNYASKLMEEQDPVSLPVEILACAVAFSSPSTTREKMLEELLIHHIKSPSFPTTMPVLFKILRNVKSSNYNLCNLFWNKTFNLLKSSGKEDFKTLRICHKYMYFNNNLGGTYRHFEFEKQMMDWLLQYLANVTGYLPTKVARISAFIIGYGQSSVPSILMKKIEEMAPQFSILDCLNVSRGVQIAMELRTKNRGPHILQQLVTISSILSVCLRGHLANTQLKIPDINMLMRTYINIKGVSRTDLFELLLQRYTEVDKFMSSRMLRDVCFNLNPHRSVVPALIETMASYVTKNSCDLLGDTVEKILFFCYNTGYVPESEQFCQAAAEAVNRDCEKLSGLVLLQAALSLCFLQHMPISLIHYIFTVDFLENLDEELKLCYSKTTYPQRVRQCLMELNRAVCIDYPQADVPWFHAKYCEEQATQDTIPVSSFHKEVLNSLSSVVGGQEFVKQNTYTPYFYKLDFEVILDENLRPLPVNKKHQDLGERQITRVAVILLREDAFTTGKIQMRGPHLLRRRHLEILNYRQLEISQVLWRAMYMTDEADRQAYIAKHIWPDKNTSFDEIDTVPHME